jgi:SAM-dependent methyltransferase
MKQTELQTVEASEWTEAKIKQLLDEHEFTYQNVSLPFGFNTGGTDRSPTAKLIFPSDLSGKSVFDVGCMYGYFAFEAEERGATQIVGGEIDPNDVAKCRLLASAKSSAAKFLVWDIEHDAIPGTFDYVLCLNVLHHLRNPLAALDKLIDATREVLVLEVASFTGKDARKFGHFASLISALIRRLPMLLLGGTGKNKSATQTYFITETAIHTLLKKHRQDFARVEIKRGGQKGRYVVIAHKRRIKHLYVFAGVNNVGKSSLLNSFARRENAVLASNIGFDCNKPWSFKHYSELENDTEAITDFMVLQYNISKHLIDGDLHQYQRGLLDIIRCSERITIATLWAPAETLLRRLEEEQIKSSEPKSKRSAKKVERLLDLFKNAALFESIYTSWLDFAKGQSEQNFIVLTDAEYQAMTVEEWMQKAHLVDRLRDGPSMGQSGVK